MDISFETVVTNMDMADAILRDTLGADVDGLTVGTNTRVHLINPTQDNQITVNEIIHNLGLLIVTADKTIMNEGDADPVISCSDALITSDTDIGYIVLLDGVEYASGTDTIVAGVAELTLSSPTAGVYEIFLYRLTDNYASQSLTITVNEV